LGNVGKMKMYKTPWIAALGVLVSATAYAARFPDAVEKRIVLTGPAAVSVAELFGLSPSSPHSVSLPLGRGDAWAVYLLKQDTEEKLWNDNEGSPARYNAMEMSYGPVPALAVSPYWLDLGTRLPETKAGYYSFGSPFMPAALDGEDPWTRLVRRLKAGPGWDENAQMPFRRRFASPDGVELCIEVFGVVQYPDNKARAGYIVTITTYVKNTAPSAKGGEER